MSERVSGVPQSLLSHRGRPRTVNKTSEVGSVERTTVVERPGRPDRVELDRIEEVAEQERLPRSSLGIHS